MTSSIFCSAGVLLTRNRYSRAALGAFFIVPTIAEITRGLFGGLDPEASPKRIGQGLRT